MVTRAGGRELPDVLIMSLPNYVDNHVPWNDPALAWAHVVSVVATVGTVLGYLSPAVALIPAIYYSLLIWETKTVQKHLRRRKMRNRKKA